MNMRNLFLSTGSARVYYAADGVDASGGAGDDAGGGDPSILGDAGDDAGADDAADEPAGDTADKPADDAEKPADGEGEQTDEQKAEAEAALAVPFEGLKAPEGFEALDADLLAAATPIMRGQLGIDTPEKAQAFVDAVAPILGQAVEKAVTAHTAQAQEAISTEVKGWVDTSKAQFNGEALAHAARFRDRFATTDEQKALIREAPIFNHPLVVKMFVDGGKALAEDAIHQSDQSTQTGPKDMGSAMYGDMKPVAPAD